MSVLAASILNRYEALPKAKSVRTRFAVTEHQISFATENSPNRRQDSCCAGEKCLAPFSPLAQFTKLNGPFFDLVTKVRGEGNNR